MSNKTFALSSISTGTKSSSVWDKSAYLIDYQQISTVNLTAGSQSTIEFNNIPQVFTHLQIRAYAKNTSAGNVDCRIRFNGDTTNSWYSVLQSYGNNSSFTSGIDANSNRGTFIYIPGSNLSAWGIGIIDITDYTSTSKTKHIKTIQGFEGDTTTGFCLFRQSLGKTQKPITSIQIYPDTDSFAQYSHVALYGVK